MVAAHPVDAEDALPGRQQLGAEPHVDGPEHLAVDDPAQRLAGLVDAQDPADPAAGVERARLVPARGREVVHRRPRRGRRHRVQAVQGALVDLAGDRDPALGLEAAHRLGRGGVVAAADVAEQPLDRHQPGLEVADLVAPVAPAARIAGPGCSTLNIWSCVGRSSSPPGAASARSTTPVARRPRLAWKPLTASGWSRRTPRWWSRAATRAGTAGSAAPHLLAAVAGLEDVLGLRLRARRGGRRGRRGVRRRWASGSSTGWWWGRPGGAGAARASCPPYSCRA